MAATFLFTLAAVIAFLPVGLLLFFVLDRYAAPRVPKSLFDEKKVFLTFAVGIPLGIVLGVIFLAYASSLTAGDLGGASLLLLVFVLAAALLRRILVLTKTFGGVGGSDPLVPVHAMSYGAVSGGTVALALGFDLFGAYPNATLSNFLVLGGTALDLVVVEGWAGLRFGRAMRKGFSWLPPLPVMGGEILALLALAPAFSGFPDVAAVSIPVFFVGAAWYLAREEPRALRDLRRSRKAALEPTSGKFGRASQEESGESADPLPSSGSEASSHDGAPAEAPSDGATSPPDADR